jgi:hypothetical protein
MEEWMTTPRFIHPWVGKAGGQLYGEPHTWSLPASRSGKSEFAPVLMNMNKHGRGHTGAQIHFPPTFVAGWEF